MSTFCVLIVYILLFIFDLDAEKDELEVHDTVSHDDSTKENAENGNLILFGNCHKLLYFFRI